MGNETKWTKWTKGPWVREKDGSVKDANGEIVGATGLALITGYRDPSDPAFANAHLIAAAPDLYEELEKARRTIQALIDDGYMGYLDFRSNIDAALTKARGEQS